MPLPCDTDLTHLLFHTQKHPEKHTDSMDDTGSPLTVIMLRNIAVGVLFLILRQQGRISVISTSAYLQNCSVVEGHESVEGTFCKIYCTSKGTCCETGVNRYTAICYLYASIFISPVSTLKF